MAENEDPKHRRELEGRYANYFEVGHNEIEFVLDFGQLYPEAEGPVFHTRIAIVPAFAKELAQTLQQSLREYELSYGPLES
jgi:hypothetical protein